MEKRVVLFACIEKNIGDDLFIYTVANRYKKCQLLISSEAKYGTLETIDNLSFNEDLGKWIKYSNQTSRNPLKEIKRICNLKKLSKAVGHFEVAIYIVGNAFKNMRYNGKIDSRWIKERIGISDKFFLLSTNFGPYTDKRWKYDCTDVFHSITDICFRDKSSYNSFSELTNIRCKPDAVLSLGKKPHLSNDYVVVSMIDCSMNGRPEKIQVMCNSFENKICEIINYYNSLGKKVVLLNSNTIQDQPASKRVYDKIRNHDNLSIYNYDGNINEIFKLFSNAELVFATRLHTIILSWLHSVPVIPIIYDIKVKGLLEECEFNSFSIDIGDIDKIAIGNLDRITGLYEFELSEQIIRDANEQFLMTDQELLGG